MTFKTDLERATKEIFETEWTVREGKFGQIGGYQNSQTVGR